MQILDVIESGSGSDPDLAGQQAEQEQAEPEQPRPQDDDIQPPEPMEPRTQQASQRREGMAAKGLWNENLITRKCPNHFTGDEQYQTLADLNPDAIFQQAAANQQHAQDDEERNDHSDAYTWNAMMALDGMFCVM